MWIQQTAELWLLLQLTGSGTAVGVHSVLRFGPVLVLGAHGGLVGDLIERRKLMLATQSLLAASAIVVATAAWTGRLSVGLIYSIVAVQGLINAIDNPLRKAIVRDLVADQDLANAVGLHGSVATLTRTIGPALAGLTITSLGTHWCFTINAASYLTIILVVATLDKSTIRPQVSPLREDRNIRAGLRYAWDEPTLRYTLIVSFIVGTFGWNWSTLLPFYATDELGGGANLYGILVSLLSLGAFTGALLAARQIEVTWRYITISATMISISLCLIGISPNIVISIMALLLLGLSSTSVIVGAQARIHTHVSSVFSGRILALFSVAFVGSKPVGGLLAGLLADIAGTRVAFGASSLMIGLMAIAMLRLSAPGRGERQSP